MNKNINTPFFFNIILPISLIKPYFIINVNNTPEDFPKNFKKWRIADAYALLFLRQFPEMREVRLAV
jgi:hypothetical protein